MGTEKHEHFDWDKMPDDAPEPYMPVEFSFSFEELIDEDGIMRLPPCTGDTQTKIDRLPGAADLRQE
jgi:hypothetical protein